MGRFAFVFLMIPALALSLTSHLTGQQTESNERISPTIRAAEPSETSPTTVAPESVLSETKSALDSAVMLPKQKKNLSFTEELFSNPLNYVLLLVVCVYVYLMFLQPKGGRREQRALAERLKNLKKNDRVVTSAGIHGIVANINSEADTITLRVDENSNAKLTIDRVAIRSVES